MTVQLIKENSAQPLLTIAIPTYNRSVYLDLCLCKLSQELDSLTNYQRKLITIYISDNHSSDNTADVVSRYQLMNAGQFKYVRNNENIGAECNIVQCYSMALTPYVWVLGDDDTVLSGGLSIILNILQKQDVDVLYLNGYSYSDSYLDEPKRGRGKKGIVEYSNALKFVKNTHVMLTFISALIVRSGVNLRLTGHVTEGSSLPQLGWVLPSIRDGKKFVEIKNRVYASKSGNSGGYAPIKTFGKNLSDIAKSIFEKQPRLAKTIQNGAIITWFPSFTLNFRKGEHVDKYLSENVGVDFKLAFKKNWRYYFFIYPLEKLPLSLAYIYYKFIRLVRFFSSDS
jgi:Predicted glycosyltransferases